MSISKRRINSYSTNITTTSSETDNEVIKKEEILESNEDTCSKIENVEKKVKKRKTIKIEYEKTEPPKNWEITWNKIEEMRSKNIAPVDEMGCSRLGDTSDPKVFRYQTLIGLMLSSQTKDEQTSKAISNLKEFNGLTVDSMLTINEKKLDELISNVGFHTKKAHYIKQATEILATKYDKDIPPTYEEIIDLPGVGPKMGHLLMQVGWNKTIGIGVDVHVHRISNLLGWVHNTTDPEKTRVALESWLPYDKWNKINIMLVGFGQTICTPIRPKCESCLLSSGLCPSAFLYSKKSKKKFKKNSSIEEKEENKKLKRTKSAPEKILRSKRRKKGDDNYDSESDSDYEASI